MRALVLVLLVPLALAQGPLEYEDAPTDPTGVFAPVQLVVDRVPHVLDDAIIESLRDGTPDRAERESELLVAFAADWDPSVWPEASVASSQDTDAAYAFVQDVVHAVAAAPPEIGRLSRVDAACEAWRDTATRAEVRQWRADQREADQRLETLQALFVQLAADAPDTLNATPLENAAATIEAWEVPQRTEACVVLAADRVGVDLEPDEDHLFLVPSTSFPTGRVLVLGQGTPLSAPTLGWSASPQAGLRQAFIVPQEAIEGDHPVRLGEAGAVLHVAAAPLELRVHAPLRVTVNETFLVRVEAVTPAPHLLTDVRLEGDLQEQRDWNGTARFHLQAPQQPQTLRLSVVAGGWPLANASEAFQVQVEDPEPFTAQGGGGRGFGGGIGTFPEIPLTPLTLVLAVLGALVLFGLVEAVLSLRRGPPAPTGLSPTEPAPAGRPGLPAGLVAAFAALVAYLVRIGAARPSQTPREVMRDHDAEPVAHAFERTRYGGEAPRPGTTERTGAFLNGLLQHLRGRP